MARSPGQAPLTVTNELLMNAGPRPGRPEDGNGHQQCAQEKSAAIGEAEDERRGKIPSLDGCRLGFVYRSHTYSQ